MEKLEKYSAIIEEYLRGMVHEGILQGVEEHLIVDKTGGYFQLMRTGWAESHFRIGITIHIQLKKDGKVWILSNWTEEDVHADLANLGISKSDIVLGYLPDYARKLAGYADV